MPYPTRLTAFATLAPLALCLSACAGAPPDAAAAEPRAPASSAVRLAPVRREPVTRPIRGTGVLRLKRESDLAFKVGGVVTSVLVEEGAQVKKGQLLARIDPVEVASALEQAKEGAMKAERDLERAKRLHAQGVVPVAEVENAETGARVARAGVRAAAFNAERSSVVSPDDGRVDKRLIEPGEVVAPGQPAFHVSGRSKGAVVRIGLSDRDVLRVREGDRAAVVLDARPSRPFAGKVSQIATTASPGSGTFDVEVRLEGGAEGLLSGLTAKVTIDLVDEGAVAAVPLGAIVDGRGEDAAVFFVAGGVAKKAQVKVAFLRDDIAALSSLPDGVTVVVGEGALGLEDGAAVRVLP